MSFWQLLDLRGRLLLLSLLLLSVSLFEPEARLPSRVYDWFFVIDITQSMNVRDVVLADNSISRLELSKLEIRRVLRSLPCGSRVSLGLFTERSTANIVHPLEVCAHFGALDETITRIDWRMAWAADSYVAHGIYSAVGEAAKLDPDMRVAFFTDGHQAPEISARYAPVFEGEPGRVKGFVFGVGGTPPSQIPMLDHHDNVTGYWEADDVQRYASFGLSETQSVLEMEKQQTKGYHGRNAPHGSAPEELTGAHLSALNESRLQKIAKDTGLNYYRIAERKDAASLITSRDMSVWRSAVSDLRPWLALPALWLIFIFYLPTFIHAFIQQHIFTRKKL